jgi:hypothetical protein
VRRRSGISVRAMLLLVVAAIVVLGVLAGLLDRAVG